jgi:enoyl-CoA hydratase/carnithine racemase
MARGAGVMGLPESISGIIPGCGGTQRMARLLGAGRAVELILTGALFDAEEAAAIGLVSRAVEADQLLEEAMVLARQMAGQPALSVQGVKRAVHLGSNMSMDDGTAEEARNFMAALISRDAASLSSLYMERMEGGSTPVETFNEFRKGNAVELHGN